MRVYRTGRDEPETRYWFLSRLDEVKGDLVDRPCGRVTQFKIVCITCNRIATHASKCCRGQNKPAAACAPALFLMDLEVFPPVPVAAADCVVPAAARVPSTVLKDDLEDVAEPMVGVDTELPVTMPPLAAVAEAL